MKVSLLSFTPDALNLLLKTKNTRLKFDQPPEEWTEAQRMEHLEYMRDTIKSSWEFVEYVFRIDGVTRAFTHQLVRTRTGSYAQEAMRVVDASEHPVDIPPKIADNPRHKQIWDAGVGTVMQAYAALLEEGAAPQDARGALPTNITTSIMCKFNLRTLHEMAKLRLCTRTQGEYQDVFRAMRDLVHTEHPWVAEHGFLEVHCVSTGTCAFPRYGKNECPVWDPILDNTRARLLAAAKWNSVRHEASPVAREGKAM